MKNGKGMCRYGIEMLGQRLLVWVVCKVGGCWVMFDSRKCKVVEQDMRGRVGSKVYIMLWMCMS